MNKLFAFVYADAAASEHTRFAYKLVHQGVVCREQVFCRIRVKAQETLVCFKCVLDLLYFPWLSQYAFSVNNCSHLVERERVVLYGKRGMNRLDSVLAPQLRICVHVLPCGDTTYKLADLRNLLNYSIRHGKRRGILLLHAAPPTYILL